MLHEIKSGMNTYKKALPFLLLTMIIVSLFSLTACDEQSVSPHAEPFGGNDAAGFLGLRQQANANSTTIDDIDCFVINYAIDINMPTSGVHRVNSEQELDDLVTPWFNDEKNWFSDECPTIVFPISVTLEDGTQLTINNDEELCELYFSCCEEDDDDDDDYDDDDDDDSDDD